jgi:hypothetical protein
MTSALAGHDNSNNTAAHLNTRTPLQNGWNYNTGTCTIRLGRDYGCLNFGSNLAASASVRDRGTSERDQSGRACSVTMRNTNRMVNRSPRSFSGREALTNVLRGLAAVSGDAVEAEGAPRPHRTNQPWGATTSLIDRVVNPAGPNQRRSARRAPVTRSFTPKSPPLGDQRC